MTTPTVNFLSYNSTGMNSMKSAWIRDLCKVTSTDFCAVQEHFRKTVNSFFKEQFSYYSGYVIPAVRNRDQDSGRAKGGLAQLSSKKLKIKIVRIPTKLFRVQAQVIHFPSTRLLWINSYLPTDPQTIQFDSDELEAENIMDNTSYDDVVWAGDLNWDKTRYSGFSERMKNFTEKIGVRSVWEKFPVNYTHIHTDLKATSTLDHFMVNERLIPFIQDAGVIHLGDNLSRHSPIMLKLSIGDIPAKNPAKKTNLRRPAWYKAEQEDKDRYTLELDSRLSDLVPPPSLLCSDPLCQDQCHTKDRDSFVLDIMSTVIEVSHSTIPMGGGGKTGSDPDKSCPIQKTVPGWRDEVMPYKEDAVFWHSVWESAGRPNKGALRDIMANTRNKYHYCIRRVKKMAGSIRAKKLFEASENGSVDLLKEMKKIKGSKKTQEDLPDIVEGVTGEDLIVERCTKLFTILVIAVKGWPLSRMS